MKRLRFFRCRLLPFFCGRGVGPLRLCLPVPAVCSCRKDVSDSVCVSTFPRRESALFGERLPVVTGRRVSGLNACVPSVRRYPVWRRVRMPVFPGWSCRGGMGKSRDGLSGYRQAGCFAIGRNPVRSSVPVLLSVIFLCLDKACLAKWFMLEGPGFQVVRELVFREAV